MGLSSLSCQRRNLMIKIIFPIIAVIFFSKNKRIWRISFSTLTFIVLPILIIFPTFFSTSFSNNIFLDSLNSSIILLTIWITPLILIARQKIFINNLNFKKFVKSVIILSLILIITFSCNNLILFYIFFEASLIPTFIIILGWGAQPERVQARTYLIIYTVSASLPLLIIIILIAKWNNSIFILFQITIPFFNPVITTPIWLILCIAFIVKIPLYSTHLWLPKAHVEAPVAGSIVLAAILLKLGRYGIIRIFSIFFINIIIIKSLFISLSLIGAIFTRLICLRQTDLKALIAYSSVGHIGILISASVTATQWAWQGALITIIAHGLTSSGLFAICNIVYENTNTRSLLLTKGILAIFPIIASLWFILCLCNIAGPPRINLLGEIIIIAPPLYISQYAFFPLVALRFLGGAYSLHLYTTTIHGQPAIFSNSSALFSKRNFLVIILHLIPALTLFLKIDAISIYL